MYQTSDCLFLLLTAEGLTVVQHLHQIQSKKIKMSRLNAELIKNLTIKRDKRLKSVWTHRVVGLVFNELDGRWAVWRLPGSGDLFRSAALASLWDLTSNRVLYQVVWAAANAGWNVFFVVVCSGGSSSILKQKKVTSTLCDLFLFCLYHPTMTEMQHLQDTKCQSHAYLYLVKQIKCCSAFVLILFMSHIPSVFTRHFSNPHATDLQHLYQQRLASHWGDKPIF